jgi:hypothetical protein
MAHFPKVHRSIRAPRTHFKSPQPADFRIEHQLLKGGVQRLSTTGGCAVFSKQIKGGTIAEIAIPTPLGPICGIVEFVLDRKRSAESPEYGFRFLAFNDSDYERLMNALRQFG